MIVFAKNILFIQLNIILKKCTHFGESRYIASTQKLSDRILSDIYFCGVLNVAAFYYFSQLHKNEVFVISLLREYENNL